MVRVTNCKADGATFANNLSLHPVHDSNGVYRFCIGVQFEVTRDTSLKTRLAKLDKLIKEKVPDEYKGIANDLLKNIFK